MRKRETRIVKKLVTKLKEHYGDEAFGYKVHGSPYQMRGLPDLVYCIRGRYVGIEVKVPGQEPDELQLYRLNQIANAGGIAIWGDDADGLLAKIIEIV